MPERWTPGDVLDYEVLLEGELSSSSHPGNSRDWFQGYKGRLIPKRIICSWLESRVKSTHTVLPGSTVNRLIRISSIVTAFFGLLAGVGLGWGGLAYSGSHPVNLFLILVLLAGIPFLLTSIAIILSFLPTGIGRSGRLTHRLIKILRGMVSFLKRLGLIDRVHADAVISGITRFRNRSAIYHSLLRWSVSSVIQLRAFCFHLGILVAVLWRGIVQDVAFAWQTTLNINPENLYRFTRFLSRPWKFFISPPVLEQVEGSRIILKEGIIGLNNSDLVVWWPFLCLLILTYGVLPRLLLLGYSLIRKRIVLATLPFSDTMSKRLLMLMMAPRVEVTGDEPPREFETESSSSSTKSLKHESMDFQVLIPSYREDLMMEDSWMKYLSVYWGASLEQINAVSLDDEEDAHLLASLSRQNSGRNGLLVVFEGWRPYTAAAGLYVDSILTQLPSGTAVFAALAGRPGMGFKMEDCDKEDFRQWKRLLPGDVGSGICEIVELEGWQ